MSPKYPENTYISFTHEGEAVDPSIITGLVESSRLWLLPTPSPTKKRIPQ